MKTGASERRLLYLSKQDVVSAGVGTKEIIGVLEVVFREKGKAKATLLPRLSLHPVPDSFLYAMPAYVPAEKALGIKWIAGFPKNFTVGLPYISGLIILNDLQTGFPVAVMDCGWVTAKRTGAATAVAAKWLARPDSSVVGILGCGVQGRSNLEALAALFPIEKVMAYDVNPDALDRYVQEMCAVHQVEVVPVSTPRQAVAGCDIVVTAGPILKVPHATIKAGWLEPGAFASLIDYDSYWHSEALREADKICTDDIPQLERYKEHGYFHHMPPIYAELGELVTGQRPGRESATERIIACNLGLALEDVAVATLVYHRAVKKGIGTWLPL